MKRTIILGILLGAFLMTANFAPAAWPLGKKNKRPNIVILFVDDMGYSNVGCFGGEIETPNIDKLAANGVRLTQFYNTSRCCPSRASLLTGLYSHQAGIGMMVYRNLGIGYRGQYMKGWDVLRKEKLERMKKMGLVPETQNLPETRKK